VSGAVVLVGWRSSERWRTAAWAMVRAFWEASGYPLFVGGSTQEGPFSRAAARNEAARLAGDWDVAIVADADCLLELASVGNAVTRARAGHGLILPYRHFLKLGQAQTQRILGGHRLPRTGHDRRTLPVGGCLVVPRAVWDRVGGYDERFAGWGYEDTSFWAAAGGAERVDGVMWHLWHPTDPGTAPNAPTHVQNRILAAEYGRNPATGDWPEGLKR
jgi:hypothetical protein